MRLSVSIVMSATILLFNWWCIPNLLAQDDINSLYRNGLNAQKSGDTAVFLKNFKALNELRPYHPVILKKLALAYYDAKQPTQAFRCLEHLLLVNADTLLLHDDELSDRLDKAANHQLKERLAVANQPVLNSKLLFSINHNKLHPEGIAFNPDNKTFYVSSIHQRKIIAISSDGQFQDVIAFPNEPISAVSGLHVSEGMLWGTTISIPQMIQFDSTLLEKSALIGFDLASGKIKHTIEIHDSLGHWFGDLNIHPNGDIFITDSRQPVIYKYKKGSKQLIPWMKDEKFRSLQGICFTPNGKFLFVADYANGIFVVNMETKSVHSRLLVSEKSLAKGIDGLYYYKGSLIAIQNGIYPLRITKFNLNKDFTSIENHRVLERSNPALDEPTLGVIVNDKLIYIGNSPWRHYDEENNLKVDEIEGVKIFELGLE